MSGDDFKAIILSGTKRERYRPPPHLGMKMTDFVGAYITLWCSFEALVFAAFLKAHPARPNHTLRAILPGYTAKQWADGEFSEEILAAVLDVDLNVAALREWAATLIAFDAAFQKLGVREPLKWLKTRGFIQESGDGVGWVAATAGSPEPGASP